MAVNKMADKVDRIIRKQQSKSAQWQVQVSKIGAFSNLLIHSEVMVVASSRHLKFSLDRKTERHSITLPLAAHARAG